MDQWHLASDVSPRCRFSAGAGAVFGTSRAGADPGAAVATWNGLASTIGGSVLLPSSGAQFSSRKQVFNSFYNNATLAAIVAVSSQADVQKAFASANKLKLPRAAEATPTSAHRARTE